MKTLFRRKQSKCELLRAAEHRLLLEEMLQVTAAFRLRCLARQNRRTAAELEQRGVL